MKNLAGNPGADGHVVRELLAAGIEIVPDDSLQGEVPATIVGQLAGWRFFRAWYYWIASPIKPNRGLPIDQAVKLFDQYGKQVRAGGDCACRGPWTWATSYQKDRQVVIDPKGEQLETFHRLNLSTDGLTFCPSYPDDVETYVDTYHIDTQEGLNAFAALLQTKKTLDNPVI